MQEGKQMNIFMPFEVRAQIELIARKHYWDLQDVVIEAVRAFYLVEGEPGKVQTDECTPSK